MKTQLPLILLVAVAFTCDGVSDECSNSMVVKLYDMLQEVINYNRTLYTLKQIVEQQVDVFKCSLNGQVYMCFLVKHKLESE